MNDGRNSGHHDDRAVPAGQPPGWGEQPSWGPPASPYLSPPPPPTRRFRAKHAWLLAVGVCGLILAVVAGTVLWQNRVDDRAAEEAANRSPFYLAVYNLAQEPVVRYTGAMPDGTARELTVTDAGEAYGHITADGSRIPLLIIGGKTYVKPPRDMLTGLPNGLTAKSVEGKWVTGHSALARTFADVPSSPAALATKLWTGLDRTQDFPDSDTAKVRIDGVEALSVTTPDGVLSVAATPPYRVLKLDSQGSIGGKTPSGTARLSRVTPMSLARAPGSSGLGNLALTPLSPEAVGKAYDDLIGETRTLSDAVDLGIHFDFNQSGNLSCSQTCTVTERVGTSTTAAPGAKLSGTVNASMTAQVTVNGQSGGGCSRSATLPINGTGTMSCVATGTAPIVQRIKAQKQQEANARARATGRSVRIPYTINFRAQVQISAMAFAKAEIEQKVRDQQADRTRAVETARKNAGPKPACFQNSFMGGTLALTADAEPIENAEADRFTQRQTTRDLTVADLHSYYVGVGSSTASVLVHNNACYKAKARTEAQMKGLAKDNAKSASDYQKVLVKEKVDGARKKAREQAKKEGKSEGEVKEAEDEAGKKAREFAEKDYTTAVIRARIRNPKTGEWEERTFVALSGKGKKLSSAQIAAVKANGHEPILMNFKDASHAEQKILLYVDKLGGQSIAGGVSRNVCIETCKPLINAGGGKVDGDVMPGKGTGVRTFWFPDAGTLPKKK